MGLNLNNYIWLSTTLAVLVFVLLWVYAYRSNLVIHDAQNSRSLHQGKALTGAGILMFVPWCLFGLLLAPLFVPFYMILILSVMGFVDDRYDVSFKLRLLLQTVVTVITLYAVGLTVPIWMWVFLIFSLLWWVNLFNFMDGANGMAALHGLVSLSFYGLIFADIYNDVTIFSYIILAIVLVLVVYLIFNLWLKKLFMGDSGSLPLAWIIAVMALFALHLNVLNYSQVAVIHAVFIVDATMTLFYRLIKKEQVTQAHATHMYQRLIKNGFTHLQVSAIYAGLTLLCCLLVWLTLTGLWVVQWAILTVVYLSLLVVFIKYLSLGRTHIN